MENDFKFNLGLDLSGFNSSVKKAANDMKGLGGNFKKVGSNLKNVSKEFDLFGRNGAVVQKLDLLTAGYASNILDLGRGIKQAFGAGTLALKGFKLALATTGIGLLVIAVGAIAANWDKIKATLTGVTAQQRAQTKLLDGQNKIISKNLEILENSDNILKLQGKSQIEINNLKLGELRNLIAIQRQQVVNLESSLEGAKIQEKRYAELFGNIIDFGFFAFEKLAKGFDNLFGTNISRGIAIIKGGLKGIVVPDLSSDLKKDLEDLNSELLKSQNAAAGLILKQKELNAAIASRPKDLNAVSTITPSVDLTQLSGGIDVFAPLIQSLKTSTLPIMAVVDEQFLMLQARFQQFKENFRALSVDAIGGALSSLGTNIGEALANGGNVLQSVGKGLISSLGSFLGQFADQLIQYGVAVKLFGKAQLAAASSPIGAILGGGAAIAAGIALKAIAGLTKASAQVGGGGGAGGGASTAGGGGVNGFSSSFDASNQGGGGRVVFEIAGDKLIGVLNRSARNNDRIGGVETIG